MAHQKVIPPRFFHNYLQKMSPPLNSVTTKAPETQTPPASIDPNKEDIGNKNPTLYGPGRGAFNN